MPTELAQKAQTFLAIFSVVVFLWLFTEIPLFITGLLGIATAVLFGITSPDQALAPFADPIIFLFLSGFLFAKALEVTELDQRLAYSVLSLPQVRNSPKKTVLAFLGLAFVLSMWISNTAAVAMLLPLSYGVLKKMERDFEINSPEFKENFLLSMAYSATLGGCVTPVGSPPNVIALGFLNSLASVQLSFLGWMGMSAPFATLLFAWVYKRCVKSLPQERAVQQNQHVQEFRELNREQRIVMVLFFLCVFFWITPGLLAILVGPESPLGLFLKQNLTSAIVGLFFASFLFIFPLHQKEKILFSSHASSVDWPSLLLFGAGLSLGAILFETGLAQVLADQLSLGSSPWTSKLVLAGLIGATILFTELASNTASANIILPVMLSLGLQLNFSPIVIAVAFALACNNAFMLPVATPPNVIVYGTQLVRKSFMAKTGLALNLGAWLLLGIGVLALA